MNKMLLFYSIFRVICYFEMTLLISTPTFDVKKSIIGRNIGILTVKWLEKKKERRRRPTPGPSLQREGRYNVSN